MARFHRLLFALLLGYAAGAAADIRTGQVVRIDSGDSLVVLAENQRQIKIRLAGIAAPDKLQSFGNRSTANLGAILTGQNVTISMSGEGRDGYFLGKILTAAPDAVCRSRPECPRLLDAGLQQVLDGMAWWHEASAQDLSQDERAEYARAEFDAKIHRRGLWAETNPVPPWSTRRR